MLRYVRKALKVKEVFMGKLVMLLRNKITFLLAVVGAALMGSITTAVVMAAIPGSDGIIHGCYRNSGVQNSGQLRVIDNTTSTCSSSETALDWNQSGPPSSGTGWTGYGYIRIDGTLDSARASNITSLAPSTNAPQTYCITTTVVPTLVDVSSSAGSYGVVRGADQSSDTDIDNACDSATQLMVVGSGGSGTYFFFL